tara:strand:- start:7415 stop:8188 length:774 start_codon:yes stop_codon:yes gene_type:complete
MKKNVIFFTALKANCQDMPDYMQYSLKTWRHYAKKYNCEIFILEDPIFENTDRTRPTWQRWWVYDLLEANNIEYNQVALIDLDVMVHHDCPDIFELSNNQYTGVVDDLSIEWTVNSINGYQHLFPNVNLDWTTYINNGVLILPLKGGKEFCNKVKEFYLKNEDELCDLQFKTLRKGTDQTPINFLAKEFFGNDINFISKKFNMTHMPRTLAFAACHFTKRPIFTICSYIWHFNGIERDERTKYMKQTWEYLEKGYED